MVSLSVTCALYSIPGPRLQSSLSFSQSHASNVSALTDPTSCHPVLLLVQPDQHTVIIDLIPWYSLTIIMLSPISHKLNHHIHINIIIYCLTYILTCITNQYYHLPRAMQYDQHNVIIYSLDQHNVIIYSLDQHNVIIYSLDQHNVIIYPLDQHNVIIYSLDQHNVIIYSLDQHNVIIYSLDQHNVIYSLDQHNVIIYSLDQHNVIIYSLDQHNVIITHWTSIMSFIHWTSIMSSFTHCFEYLHGHCFYVCFFFNFHISLFLMHMQITTYPPTNLATYPLFAAALW